MYAMPVALPKLFSVLLYAARAKARAFCRESLIPNSQQHLNLIGIFRFHELPEKAASAWRKKWLVER
jgi:hypothetical protein